MHIMKEGEGEGEGESEKVRERTHQEYLLDRVVPGLCRYCSCTGRTDSRRRSRKAIQQAFESRCQKSGYGISRWSLPQCLCNRVIGAVIEKAAVSVV